MNNENIVWSEWIENTTGVCPIEDGVLHQVRFFDGEVSETDDSASDWDWRHGCPCNITWYRYEIKQEEQKVMKPIDHIKVGVFTKSRNGDVSVVYDVGNWISFYEFNIRDGIHITDEIGYTDNLTHNYDGRPDKRYDIVAISATYDFSPENIIWERNEEDDAREERERAKKEKMLELSELKARMSMLEEEISSL